MCCKLVLLGIVSFITIGLCITQVGLSIHYIHNPVHCDRAELLTILSLIAGFSGIISTVLLIVCCHGCGCGSSSSSD